MEFYAVCVMPAHCCMAIFFPCVNVSYAAYWTTKSVTASFVAELYFFLTYTAGFVCTGLTEKPDGSLAFYSSSGEDTNEMTAWSTAGIVCALLFAVSVAVLRHAVRKSYRIPGSPFADFCVAFFCSCCAAAQLSGHTEYAKKRRDTASTLPGYTRV